MELIQNYFKMKSLLVSGSKDMVTEQEPLGLFITKVIHGSGFLIMTGEIGLLSSILSRWNIDLICLGIIV